MRMLRHKQARSESGWNPGLSNPVPTPETITCRLSLSPSVPRWFLMQQRVRLLGCVIHSATVPCRVLGNQPSSGVATTDMPFCHRFGSVRQAQKSSSSSFVPTCFAPQEGQTSFLPLPPQPRGFCPPPPTHIHTDTNLSKFRPKLTFKFRPKLTLSSHLRAELVNHLLSQLRSRSTESQLERISEQRSLSSAFSVRQDSPRLFVT